MLPVLAAWPKTAAVVPCRAKAPAMRGTLGFVPNRAAAFSSTGAAPNATVASVLALGQAVLRSADCVSGSAGPINSVMAVSMSAGAISYGKLTMRPSGR